MLPENKLTILLADDSPDDAFFFRRTLQKTGLSATLHIAENGRQAIEYLMNRGAYADAQEYPRPAIIFVDLKMPEVDGFELLSWISGALPAESLQTVVLTASDQPQDHQRALELGAHQYFVKPITVEQLCGLLQRLQLSSSAVQHQI